MSRKLASTGGATFQASYHVGRSLSNLRMSFNMRRKLRHSPSQGNESPHREGAELVRAREGDKAGAEVDSRHSPRNPSPCTPPSPPRPRLQHSRFRPRGGARALPLRLRGEGRVRTPAQCVGHGLIALLRSSFLLVLTREKEKWYWIWICFGWIKEGTRTSSERRKRSALRTQD